MKIYNLNLMRQMIYLVETLKVVIIFILKTKLIINYIESKNEEKVSKSEILLNKIEVSLKDQVN